MTPPRMQFGIDVKNAPICSKYHNLQIYSSSSILRVTYLPCFQPILASAASMHSKLGTVYVVRHAKNICNLDTRCIPSRRLIG